MILEFQTQRSKTSGLAKSIVIDTINKTYKHGYYIRVYEPTMVTAKEYNSLVKKCEKEGYARIESNE